MMSSWKNDDAFWISAPSPCWAAISSEATSVAQATPSATRSAVRICGTASGRITLPKTSPSVAPSVRATRMKIGLIWATPSYITITPAKNDA